MKRVIILSGVAALALSAVSCDKPTASEPIENEIVLMTAEDSVSYEIGVLSAKGLLDNMEKQGEKDLINLDAFIAGVKDASYGKEKIDKVGADVHVSSYFRKKSESKSEVDKIAGERFLAANKNKEGIITTDSGLQYEVIEEGDGSKPTSADKVKVDYHGTLIDGTVFDSSIDRGTPAEFPVTGVIKGWIEGLQLMNVGSKYRFYIPSDLAYGANPRPGGPIKPHSALIFDVTLLEILE